MHLHPLRPFQQEALESLRTHSHTLLISPTGSGKSLVFQHYIRERLNSTSNSIRTLLISPLSALSRQHLKRFESLRIPVTLGVGPTPAGPPLGSGVWIVSPEKISGSGMRRVREWKPNFLIMDEAHCIWEWGETFRPAFNQVPLWVKELQIEKSFWCTATLPGGARSALAKALPGALRTMGRFSAPDSIEMNLEYSRPFERMDRLQALIRSWSQGSGMIFVNTRSSSERVQKYLDQWGVNSLFYHAGMGAEERLALESEIDRKREGPNPIWVVATSAFGMGMDYPFLRYCILFEPSFSLLSLAQAIGRVGRSGEPGKATVFWHPDDFNRHEWLSERSKRNRKHLLDVKAWCEAEGNPKERLEHYFNS